MVAAPHGIMPFLVGVVEAADGGSFRRLPDWHPARSPSERDDLGKLGGGRSFSNSHAGFVRGYGPLKHESFVHPRPREQHFKPNGPQPPSMPKHIHVHAP